jgi:hypothetical protein
MSNRTVRCTFKILFVTILYKEDGALHLKSIAINIIATPIYSTLQ